jgi:hypothetical protein
MTQCSSPPPPPSPHNLSLDRSMASSKASCLQRGQSSSAPYKFKYLLFSLKSHSSSLLLIPRLLFPSIFRSVTCFRRQFLSKMWPIQLAFLHFIVYRMMLSSLTVHNASSYLKRSAILIFSILLQHHIRYFWSIFRSVQVSSSTNVAIS